VAASFYLRLNDGKVAEVRLAYGGMAATPKRAPATEAALQGKPWTLPVVRDAASLLAKDFQPISDHRATAGYRQLLAMNLLLGFQQESERNDVAPLAPQHAGTVGVPR